MHSQALGISKTRPSLGEVTGNFGDDIARVTNLADLTRIYDPDVQLCYLPRASEPSIEAYLHAACDRLGGGLRQVLSVEAGMPMGLLPDLPGRERFAEDVSGLMVLLGDLLDCPSLVLRLEVTRHAMCPRFHVDRTGIRLLCTYRGPGSQWLGEAHAQREHLGHAAGALADEDTGLILCPNAIGEIPRHAIALLKGSLWQGNAGRGAIHRSPSVPLDQAPRVLLALDALWD